MPIKKIDEITDKQIKDNGVQALADRPNLPNQYGASGLSASQLKAWFDKLATFLAHRINEITNALSSEDAASYIRVQLDEYDVDNLGDLITAFSNGGFASKILKVYPDAGATETTSLQSLLSIIAQTLSEQSSKIYSIETNISDKFNSIVDLSSEQTIDGVKYFTGFNYFGRVDELEGNTSIVGSDILIRTDDKLSWYRGDYIMFYSADLTTWTQYNNGVISHCYLPPDGGLPITIDLAIPKGESYNRTIATREWVEEQGFADSDALDGKVTKVIPTAGDILYGQLVNGNTWNPIASKTNLNEYVVPIRSTKGNIVVPIEPSADNMATSKQYVDEAVANAVGNAGGKLYEHSIIANIVIPDGNFSTNIRVISSVPTAFTTFKDFMLRNPAVTEQYGMYSYSMIIQMGIYKSVEMGSISGISGMTLSYHESNPTFSINGLGWNPKTSTVERIYISLYGDNAKSFFDATISDTVKEL